MSNNCLKFCLDFGQVCQSRATLATLVMSSGVVIIFSGGFFSLNFAKCPPFWSYGSGHPKYNSNNNNKYGTYTCKYVGNFEAVVRKQLLPNS